MDQKWVYLGVGVIISLGTLTAGLILGDDGMRGNLKAGLITFALEAALLAGALPAYLEWVSDKRWRPARINLVEHAGDFVNGARADLRLAAESASAGYEHATLRALCSALKSRTEVLTGHLAFHSPAFTPRMTERVSDLAFFARAVEQSLTTFAITIIQSDPKTEEHQTAPASIRASFANAYSSLEVIGGTVAMQADPAWGLYECNRDLMSSAGLSAPPTSNSDAYRKEIAEHLNCIIAGARAALIK